jgi:hypothetical protein
MKKGKVFFHPIDGSASLTISWSSGPKGNAIEAKNGNGVGFFSDTGDLLCVIFDEVLAAQDQQKLEFNRYCVEINVKNGRVNYFADEIKQKPTLNKNNFKRRRSAKKVSIER